MSMGNVADGYTDVGRRADALRLNEELLVSRRRVLGPDHPDTLMVTNNLASSYKDVGRWADALTLIRPMVAVAVAKKP